MCRRKYFFTCFSYHHFGTNFVARGDYVFDIDEKCACKNELSHEVCGFCFSVKYLLSFNCYKICVKEVTHYFVDKVVTIDTYLKKMNCDPFVFLSCKTRLLN